MNDKQRLVLNTIADNARDRALRLSEISKHVLESKLKNKIKTLSHEALSDSDAIRRVLAGDTDAPEVKRS